MKRSNATAVETVIGTIFALSLSIEAARLVPTMGEVVGAGLGGFPFALVELCFVSLAIGMCRHNGAAMPLLAAEPNIFPADLFEETLPTGPTDAR